MFSVPTANSSKINFLQSLKVQPQFFKLDPDQQKMNADPQAWTTSTLDLKNSAKPDQPLKIALHWWLQITIFFNYET